MMARRPNAIVRDGTIFLITGSRWSGIDYTTSLVTARLDGGTSADAAADEARCRSPACATLAARHGVVA